MAAKTDKKANNTLPLNTDDPTPSSNITYNSEVVLRSPRQTEPLYLVRFHIIRQGIRVPSAHALQYPIKT